MQIEDTVEKTVIPKIRAKIRFDYKGKSRPARFFFGGKNSEEVADELREQQAALWRNVPLQGIMIEKIDLGEIYFVYDEETDDEVAFAPLELEVIADSLWFLVRFAVREEFRRVKIIEPPELTLSLQEMEQIFFEVHNQTNSQVKQRLKRYAD
ncbi:MAG: hypothetical protein GX197_07235 [Firmicutes bacterium]|nr:hypothetical protein [Bacillota bacterium]